MITPSDLNLFQHCRAKWKLNRDYAGDTSTTVDSYTQALRKTIFQMYSWLFEKNKPINDRQIRERWDKNWWESSLDKGTLTQKEILEKTASGWMLLEKYWADTYLEEMHLIPVATNFEFSYYAKDLHYRISVDLLLANKEDKIELRQFGGKKTEWELYTGLDTRLEVVALQEVTGKAPVTKTHVNILNNEDNKIKLALTERYMRESQSLIKGISSDLANGIIYPSPSQSCLTCQYAGKCWF